MIFVVDKRILEPFRKQLFTLRAKKIVCAGVYMLCLFIHGCYSFGQLPVENSLYSAYGLGYFKPITGSRNFGMGFTGAGLGGRFVINPVNPAANCNLDAVTFDMSTHGYYNYQEGPKDKDLSYNFGGLNTIAFVFKKQKPLAFTFGITPLTTMGFAFRTHTSINQNDKLLSTRLLRTGEGGLNQAYCGMSFGVFKQRLAIGIESWYLFGTLKKNWTAEHSFFDNNAQEYFNQGQFVGSIVNFQELNTIRGFGTKIGLLYSDSLRLKPNKENLTYRLGIVTDRSFSITSQNRFVLQTFFGQPSFSTNDTTYGELGNFQLTKTPNSNFQLPNNATFGFSIEKTAYWAFSVDFGYRDQSKLKEKFVKKDPLEFNYFLRIGAEIVPDPKAFKSYLRRIAYRAGLDYEVLGLVINGVSVKSYGVYTSLGLPLSFRNSSVVTVGFGYTRFGTTSNNLILEQRIQAMLGLSFTEIWYNPIKFE